MSYSEKGVIMRVDRKERIECVSRMFLGHRTFHWEGAILSEGSLTLGLNSFTVLGAQEHREMTRSPIAENEVGCVAE